MRRPLSPVAKPRRCRSRSPANQTYRTQAAATSTAVLQAAQVSCIPGSRKRWGTAHSRSQARRKESRRREATAAVRCQKRPMPGTREMTAQRSASTSRAGAPLGTGSHTGVKSPLIRPKIARVISVAAKTAWPQLAMRMARSLVPRRLGLAPGRAPSSAHGLLHERADSSLFGGGQLLQREGGRPQGAGVEVRRVAEAERRVPRLALLRALEEADDLAVLGIRGHPVPESRREGWRAGFDDRMEPLAQDAIRSRHRGDRREHGAFPVGLVRARAGPRGRLLRGFLGRALGASG